MDLPSDSVRSSIPCISVWYIRMIDMYYMIKNSNNEYISSSLTPTSNPVKFKSYSDADIFLRTTLMDNNSSFIGVVLKYNTGFTIEKITVHANSEGYVSTDRMMEMFNTTCIGLIANPTQEIREYFANSLKNVIQSVTWYGFRCLSAETIDFICNDPRVDMYMKDVPRAMRDNPEDFMYDGVFTDNPEKRAVLYLCSSEEHIQKYSLGSTK